MTKYNETKEEILKNLNKLNCLEQNKDKNIVEYYRNKINHLITIALEDKKQLVK